MTLRESFDKILDIVELNPELNEIFAFYANKNVDIYVVDYPDENEVISEKDRIK